ncbi:hypothetical protein [Burkholderia ubonensis]|uniref:hypothetical protein n=1 Tax=Burkholderia ubonensis TaxID=101571 RepID=UPI000756419C|nr:hypothetical protein [Burkholderia ubonensis]KVW77439.1 hypothetical protein WK99_27990 [Burkholderia ubonensis]
MNFAIFLIRAGLGFYVGIFTIAISLYSLHDLATAPTSDVFEPVIPYHAVFIGLLVVGVWLAVRGIVKIDHG